MLACTDLYRPQDPSQYSTLSVLHLSLDTGAMHTTGILSDGWEVYASADNLYVAQTSWWSWWGWDELDMTSNIHRFQLDSATGASYVGSGAVDGWLYDQFAMSEYEGLLRVVSTDQDWWWGAADDGEEQPGNNVFVLQDDGQGRLQQLGALRGIAPGDVP